MMGKLQKITKMYYFRQMMVFILVCCMVLGIPLQVAQATVSNPDVVAGLAGISQSGNTTTVNVGSDKAVINWDSLNTASNEILEFLKVSGNFAVLNRVIQGGTTQFDGSLFGNQGHIIIVNPNGIVFGPTALVQASKFTASALDIANTDFMDGVYKFTGDGVGEVANYGDISADQVALIGKQVLNAGVIRSPGGFVLLAAGDKVLLGQDGSNVVVEVEGVKVTETADAAAVNIGDVINEGIVDAAGGKIVLAAGDTFSRAVEGIDSLSLAVDGGTGRVGQFGTLSADGIEGDGGSITLTAGDVVALSPDSVTTANAGTNGSGGEVIVYSPDTALFHEGAQIEAKGGSESGDGGFIEVSGKNYVEVFGQVDASATSGQAGTFLIDPTDVTISDETVNMDGDPFWDPAIPDKDTGTIDAAVIAGSLQNGTDVSVDTSDDGGGGGTGRIIVNNPIGVDLTTNADESVESPTLTLNAEDDIEINAAIGVTATDNAADELNLTLNATNGVDVGALILLEGGNFTSNGTTFINTGGPIITGGGTVNIQHSGNVLIDDVISAGTGNITINSSAGAIRDAVDDSGSPVVDMFGATISLDAASGGIGTPGVVDGVLEVAASTALNADTTADNSNINVVSIGDLPVGLVDAGTGNVDLISTGNITGVTDDDTADIAGDTINLVAAASGIRGATASDALDVTASTALNANTATDNANINIDSIGNLPIGLIVAGSGDVTLDSDSAIRDAVDDSGSPVVDVVGATIDLTAASGGIGTPGVVDGVLEVAATTEFNANTADNSNINVVSIGNLPVGLVDAGDGAVDLLSTGNITGITDNDTADIAGSTISLVAVAGGIRGATASDALDVTASTALNANTATDNANINIDSIGNLPIGLVVAGSGDVTLDSDSAIRDAVDDSGSPVVDVVGATINLDATSGGIGTPATGVLEVAASTEFNADTADNSNINVVSIGNLPVGLVDAGTGNVDLISTGNITGVTDDDTADIAGDTISLVAAVGGIRGTTASDSLDVTASTALNANTADNSNINIDSIGDLPIGLVIAGDGDVTLDSDSAIRDAVDDSGSPVVDVVGATINLTAATGGIGTPGVVDGVLEVAALIELNADTVSGDGSDILIDSVVDLPVGLVDAGIGDVTLDSTGSIDSTSDDDTADVVGGEINLIAAAGGIGTTSVVDVSASTELNADTVNGDGSNILIDSIGDLPVGLVDADSGNVTLDVSGAITSVDPDDDVADITANLLTVEASTSVGAAGNMLDLDVTTSNITTDGDVYFDVVGTGGHSTTIDSAAGNIEIDGRNTAADGGYEAIVLADVDTDDGTVTVYNYGNPITATLVDNSVTDKDVYLETVNSGNIIVDQIIANAAADVVLISASSVEDNQDSGVDITGGNLVINAATGIGDEEAIETTVASLEAHTDASNITIIETDGLSLQNINAVAGSIYLEATNGGMTYGSGTITAGASTLTMVQQNSLNLENFTFANKDGTDFMAEITGSGSYFTAIDPTTPTAENNAADQWQSIQAKTTAADSGNITLQGSDPSRNIVIGTGTGINPGGVHTFDGVVTSTGGGVSIISENQGIVSGWDSINNTTLDNVTISGFSDDALDIGVDLLNGPGTGKAAIMIMDAKDLMFGDNTTLTASGTYYTTGEVDDRQGVDFLDVRAEIPEGFPRYEGDPFDVAIYLASTGGDVDVSSAVSIMSSTIMDEVQVDEYAGAMVIDAFDTVTFDESGTEGVFEDSLKAGEVGDRLEVASRITEWLYQADGRLPYSGYPYYGGGPFPLDYTYVLRGAGLDNPVISDITEGRGRAWVLVDPENAPLDREAGEKAQQQTLGLDGCPILLAAVSAELGIPEETIVVSLKNSYALNTDVQPCDSCARLIDAAAILRDEDGSRMAAMNQVFNELAPTDAPLTPEVIASIVTAFAGHVNDGTQYATAIEYIDAFVQYIAVLNSDIGSPVVDSVAYVLEKYGQGLTESENSNMAAFVASRLETGETFGQ